MHRILILDDEIPSAKMTEQLLQNSFPNQFEIVSATSVSKAIAFLSKSQFNLVF